MTGRSISILGAGWLGMPLAGRLAEQGYHVSASTTTPEKQDALAACGAIPHLLVLRDDMEGDDIAPLFEADVIIFTLPPSAVDDYPAAAEAVRQQAERHGAGWLLMTSSTSVYPDLCRTVTEDDAGPRPGAPLPRNGAAVLAAERVLRRSGVLGTTVVRLAGLYGYGRHPARYLAGRRDLPDGDAPVNLVHRDDVIAAIDAILLAEARGTVYNVCADAHPKRRAYYPAAARALGLDPPTFAEGPPAAWKCVSGDRLKTDLGFVYTHPDPLAPAP